MARFHLTLRRSRVSIALSRTQQLKIHSRIPCPSDINNSTISKLCTKYTSDHNDLFRYTSGRWLWNEQQHLQARYKKFNVDELKRVAAASTGARSCVCIAKVAEGGYNRVFRLVMDDGSAVIARVPMMSDSAPQQRTRAIASEVATMEFVCVVLCSPVSCSTAGYLLTSI